MRKRDARKRHQRHQRSKHAPPRPSEGAERADYRLLAERLLRAVDAQEKPRAFVMGRAATDTVLAVFVVTGGEAKRLELQERIEAMLLEYYEGATKGPAAAPAPEAEALASLPDYPAHGAKVEGA